MTAKSKEPGNERSAEMVAAVELVRMARQQGLALTGPSGLLKQFTKTVQETALDEEMSEHLGREKHQKARGGRSSNARNGTIAKTVVTDAVGPVEITVPRDRDASSEPVIVRKGQRRLNDLDEVVLSMYSKGLTTGEISAHFQEIYGATVSKETVSRITDRAIEEMNEWASRSLDTVYAAVFIDAIAVKVGDDQVANRAFYAAIGVGLDGNRDVLGIWGSPASEGAKYWLSVLTELKNRGVMDVFFLICDGLKGLPDATETVWPLSIHLMRATTSNTRPRRTGTPSDATSGPSIRLLPHGCRESARRDTRTLGNQISGDQGPVAQRVGTFHPLPGLRRGDPQGHLLNQRGREFERPVPPVHPSQRAFPQRAGSLEMPLPDRALTRPDRQRPDTMGDQMGTRPQRVRHHLRRPLTGQHGTIMKNTSYTLNEIDPRLPKHASSGEYCWLSVPKKGSG
jgi:hypothetical protein